MADFCRTTLITLLIRSQYSFPTPPGSGSKPQVGVNFERELLAVTVMTASGIQSEEYCQMDLFFPTRERIRMY